jgi:hypothetical protein
MAYQTEAEEVFPPKSPDRAIAASLLGFKLALEDLRYESLLFIGERHASSVVERCLRHVVKQTKQELLGITLLTNHEVAVPTDLVEQLNSDRPHAQNVLLPQLKNPFNVCFQHTERAELLRLLQGVLNHWHLRYRVHVSFIR